MWINNDLLDIQRIILDGHLGKAIERLDNYLLMYGQQNVDDFLHVKDNYGLMVDYWRKGFADKQRNQLYDQLLHRLYVVVVDLMNRDRIAHSPFLKITYMHPRQLGKEWTIRSLQGRLESYVSDVAMLTLEPEQLRQEEGERLYEEHQRLMSDLFEYILTSDSWKDTFADAFENLLLSPVVDALDQRLMVSAIMLSAMNAFDFNKFRLLTNVYRKTSDVQLRQCALVGWVFCANEQSLSIYPEMKNIVSGLCQDEVVRKELTELQMQMFFCMSAEDDTEKIRNEIMPDLMRGNNLHFTRQGLVERDEDTMEDILHPDNAERNMERMEESMHKMMDMQKQGADIYFAGFSQMKRFTFFSQISNWFVPFYTQHPGIRHTWNQSKGRKFLHTLMKLGAFCDSDKYSFVLAFDQVLNRLPQEMLKLIDKGEAVPMPVGGQVALEEQQKPAFMRRLYLQNLYRFFRLFPQRSEFCNPFDDDRCTFFTRGVFAVPSLAKQRIEVASFLSKRHRDSEALMILQNIMPEERDVNSLFMLGTLLLRQQNDENIHKAICLFREALESEPDNAKVMMGLARAHFLLGDYEQSYKLYERLMILQPEKESVQLKAAVCLTYLSRNEEALKIFYKLNYLDADNENVIRGLAWTLTVDGKYEQALRFYDRLTSTNVGDLLNYGLCLWLSGNVEKAIDVFRHFLAEQKDSEFSIENELMSVEHDLLSTRGISDNEIRMMVDELSL